MNGCFQIDQEALAHILELDQITRETKGMAERNEPSRQTLKRRSKVKAIRSMKLQLNTRRTRNRLKMMTTKCYKNMLKACIIIDMLNKYVEE